MVTYLVFQLEMIRFNVPKKSFARVCVCVCVKYLLRIHVQRPPFSIRPFSSFHIAFLAFLAISVSRNSSRDQAQLKKKKQQQLSYRDQMINISMVTCLNLALH